MNKNKEKGWEISIGTYPGIVFGIRSYYEKDKNIHVLYLPLIDIAFYTFK